MYSNFYHSVVNGKQLACSRRSDSGARAKKKASEKAGKKRGETAPRFFPLFRSLYFSLALHYLNAWNRLVNNLYLLAVTCLLEILTLTLILTVHNDIFIPSGVCNLFSNSFSNFYLIYRLCIVID